MCGYTGPHFGGGYDDACCIDGYLWDLDSGDEDGFTSGGDLPCPSCNTASYLDDAKDDAEGVSWGEANRVLYSGAMLIENALKLAERMNPEATHDWKTKTKSVSTFDWPDRAAVLEGRADPAGINEVTICI